MSDEEFNLGQVFETVAATIPEREALVWGERRFRYADLRDRSRRLATFLHSKGLGAHGPGRGELAGHESGQDHLGLYLYNSNEFIEGMIGSYLARVAPFNVNYRYVEAELQYLLTDSAARALVYHATFAPVLARVLPSLPKLELLLQVADESGHDLLPGAFDYEAALASSAPELPPVELTPDDLYILYTGGTTGMPKGVLWRQHDIFRAAMGGRTYGTWELVESHAHLGRPGGARRRHQGDVDPSAHARGGPVGVLLLHGHGSDDGVPHRHAIDRPGGRVGDRGPRAGDRHLGGGRRHGPSRRRGARAGRPRHQHAHGFRQRGRHLERGHQRAPAGRAPQRVDPRRGGRLGDRRADGCVVHLGVGVDGNLRARAGHGGGERRPHAVLEPGDPEAGWLAQRGSVPLGYLGDAEKTARTFPVIDGAHYSVPGDRARVLADGEIELLGRDSVTINSGGEKIFAEEVEQAIIAHPAVADVVVAGRPSERWGQEVVALVQVADGHTVSAEELLEEAGKHVARFKLPKAVAFLPHIVRSPAGKADYRWARERALEA